MPVDPELEISNLWKQLHGVQDASKRSFFVWRQVALALAGPEAKPLDIMLKAWEAQGKDAAKSFFPRLRWDKKKGEQGFMLDVARLYATAWARDGAVVKVEKGANPNEVFLKWERCPWPSFADEYESNMEEDVQGCEKYLQTILADVNVFMNTNLKLETQKTIARGQGVCLRRLYI